MCFNVGLICLAIMLVWKATLDLSVSSIDLVSVDLPSTFEGSGLAIYGAKHSSPGGKWCEALSSRGQVSEIGGSSRKWGRDPFSQSFILSSRIQMKKSRFIL